MVAYQRYFFPEVGAIAGNDNPVGDVAFAAFACQTVGTTASWTQTALIEDGFGFSYPFA
ncbi:MAG: hypothetical protein JSW16_05195 [Dehalococcoidales bacterium]|nr:MAG: hypothetical protein JSW16_05195 [Dehalococcoidales bacterium]